MQRLPSARILAVITTVACSGILSATAPSASAAPPGAAKHVHLNSFEKVLLDDINQARQEHGLDELTIAAGTTDVARRWARHLAEQRQLKHNPNLASQVTRSGSKRWGTIEENVGYGPAESPQSLFKGYMRSPEHRANILDKNVHYVGIGIVRRGPFAWNAMDFVNEYTSAYGPTRVAADRTG